ncbi:AmmeMemoRadiSam system radical SAM enzyme [Chlamydiota bacterium]
MKKKALLYKTRGNKVVKCLLCSHRCVIQEDSFGVCGVRQNSNGVLYTLVYADVIAAHIDPIEKKPFYHFLPGSTSFSIATIGCNFKCGFCQNWQISQQNKKEVKNENMNELLPAEVVKVAKKNGCKSISYTYTEPTVFFEYAYDAAKIAKDNGLYNMFVTNGFMTKEAIDTISPYLDAVNVDLKSFSEDYYEKICKAQLQPVLDSIKYMKSLGIWIEVTTLIVPGENDSEEELSNIASFIVSVDPEIPWHISRFHPQYQYNDIASTPLVTLRKAAEIGKKAGLFYVYMGNVLEGQDTVCPHCKKVLINRNLLSNEKYHIIHNRCQFCETFIKGVWH